MKDLPTELIPRVRQQLEENTAVSKEDIEELLKIWEGHVHCMADNDRLEELLKELGSALGDEIVDPDGSNYMRVYVDDLPEEMIEYID